MKIVKFKGGLGNQLFQYAFMKKLEQITGEKVKADLSYYSKITNDETRKPRILNFNVNIEIVPEWELQDILFFKKGKPHSLSYKFLVLLEIILNRKYYFDKNTKYVDPEKIVKYTYYDGYWQSYRYLEGIEEILRKEITLKRMSTAAIRWIDKLKNENSVFIGIRLGDYLDRKNIKIFGKLEPNYYLKAVEIIKSHVTNPLFIVFSNDIESAREYINLRNVVFFDDKEVSTEEELIIRSQCKHAIIPNSTYNWWGAWLIQNKDKIVIAPKNWFVDKRKLEIIPPTWLAIE
jgi:hypothetical protein